MDEIREARIEGIVLTRDMVPIWMRGCRFVCPLPKGWTEVIAQHGNEVQTETMKALVAINKKAKKLKPPFENLMYGYEERTEEQQEWLKGQFKLNPKQLLFDDYRGMYGAYAGGDPSSGDIYLNSGQGGVGFDNCDMCIDVLSKYFAPEAFYCHNVDFYWQALLLRELCLNYYHIVRVWRPKDKEKKLGEKMYGEK